MKWVLSFEIIERSIVQDKNFLYTIISYSIVLAIFMNLKSFQSPLIGLMTSVYFVINAVFLGNAFFEREDAFFRSVFGILLLIMLLGFVGWLTLIIHNLDVPRVTLVLTVVGTLSSLFNRRVKRSMKTRKAPSRQVFAKHLRITEILYLFMVVLSFYLLLMSRTGEAHTVWEVLHPLFIPTLFVTTFLLLRILFTSEKVPCKLLFIIPHSILIHSFFSIIFPAGDLSGQQMVLGRTRLVFDNAVLHGWAPWPMDFPSQVYEWFSGITFQAALSVVLARMLSIDFLWVHLFLVPVLWGVFVPVAAFLTAKALGIEGKVSVFSSLLISAFSYATYFGAISVPNSLGFIFFFYSFYFILKNIDSNDFKNKILMVAFSFFSLLSHPLTGVMSFSLLLLSLAFKSYASEKASPKTANLSLAISLLLCASLLPLSFIYMRFFHPATYPVRHTAFTLDKFYELPKEEIVGLFFLGELIYGFDIKTILLIVIGPSITLLSMIYLLYDLKRNPNGEFRTRISFAIVAFILILVDYRILKLFMTSLPLNEERLWVFRDFLAAPFVALAIYGVVSSIRGFLMAKSPPTISSVSLKRLSAYSKALSKDVVLRLVSLLFTGLLFTASVLFLPLLAGWMTTSLSTAYPQVGTPLQTTSYELEAVRYIEGNTREKYVVIGDLWTIFAGEVIVGVNNPRAYYFLEYNKTGYDLFSKMRSNPSSQVMIEAMTVNNATVAYFIITEHRLGTEEFDNTVSKALQNGLKVYGPQEGFGNGKLYVFSYKKED